MRKLLITLIMTLALALTFSLVVLADSVHNENTVDYSETVTLADGTVLPLFDENNEALIWYISGTNDEGKNVYSSIRSDDSRVHWNTESWGEVTSVAIHLDETLKYGSGVFVVVNMMDDDVKSNTPNGNHTNIGKAITGFKYLFRNCSNLEYVYLRLDTTGIFKESFPNCPKLKYVNLEDLTKLTRIGDNSNFANCTSLFAGQVVDLSNTALKEIDWGSSFKNVPMAGIILPSTVTRLCEGTFIGSGLVTISFPERLTVMEKNMFDGCTSLTSVCLNNKLTTIKDYAFNNCTALNTVYFVGTLDELNALLGKTSANGNDTFLAVAGENNANVISYADYLALEDKSGKYMVYNYSWCEAYNGGKHEVTGTNPCVGFCSVCENNIVKHAENAETTYKVVYENGFEYAGAKITTCTNEGCTHKVIEALPSLFKNHGYSAPENGEGGIDFKITIDREAIDAYEKLTGEEVSYGMFIVTRAIIGENDIINENGEISNGVISLEMPKDKFDIMSMKLTGFNTDEQKSAEFAFGAYVISANKPSYIQEGTPAENDKYVFISFNGITSSDEE